MPDPTPLRPAASPHKEEMLRLLDEARAEVESGKTIELVILPIYSGLGFSVWSAGDVPMIRLAGLLGRAWMDAIEALRDCGDG